MPKSSTVTASEHESVEGYEGHFEHCEGGWTVAFARGAGMIALRARTLIALAACVLVAAMMSAAAKAATFTVSNTDDAGPGVLIPGSLRQAINAANDNDNAGEIDEINFTGAAVGGTIAVTAALPDVEEPTTLDGCSGSPGATAPCVGLRYGGPPAPVDGLNATGSEVTIRGLAVTNFFVAVRRPTQAGFGFVVANNWLGIKLDGTPEGNSTGVESWATSTSISDNVIASNSSHGVVIAGADLVSIKGNRIGVDAAGKARGNSNSGIRIGDLGDSVPSTRVAIGGNTAPEENLISNNGGDAIVIDDSAELGADANFVFRNRGSGNGGLFLDLQPFDGVGNSLSGPNDGIQAPAITAATNDSIFGQGARPLATVRIFRRAVDQAGRIDAFVGETTATVTGGWQLAFPALPGGGFLVATQETFAAGTSELSESVAYVAVPAPIAVPAPAALGSSATSQCDALRAKLDKAKRRKRVAQRRAKRARRVATPRAAREATRKAKGAKRKVRRLRRDLRRQGC